MALDSNLYDRLTISTSFNRAFEIFFKRLEFFVPLGLAVFVPFSIYMYTFVSMIHSDIEALQESVNNGEDLVEANKEYWLGIASHAKHHASTLILEVVFNSIVTVFAQAVVSIAVAQIYVGRSPDVPGICQRVIQLVCNYVAASFLVGTAMGLLIAICVGVLIACIISEKGLLILLGIFVFGAAAWLHIYVSVAMMIVTPAIMIEKLGPIQAIKRCWELADNNRCFVFCTAFILGMVQGVSTQVIAGFISVGDPQRRFTGWGTVVTNVPVIVFTPVLCILTTVVYLSLRVQKEGLNQEVLEGDLLGSSSPAAAEYTIVEMDADQDLSKALYEPPEDEIL